jgi:DNA (cytosine-5)-methyltransferase 1
MKPRLLDLFCGAGLAADGYAAAGFEVIGVDINPQPDYPYKFIQADALLFLNALFWAPLPYEVIHASPPCQFLTSARHLRKAQGGTSKYPDLLTPTIEILRYLDVPWVIENVEGAKTIMQPRSDETLSRVCGSMFGLEVQRHRLFLSNMNLTGTGCEHDSFPLDPITNKPRPWGVYHVPGDSIPGGGRTARDADHARDLFGLTRDLPWHSIKEGFPPAYTRHIGRQLIRHTAREAAA